MRVAVIDADLIGRKRHRFPNLACMKISGYHKAQGDTVTLRLSYDGLDDFYAKNPGAKVYYFTTKAKQNYCDVSYPDPVFMMFGKETKGLPEDFLAEHYNECVRIPMRSEARSLNLSNAVAITVFEALRQLDFPGLCDHGKMYAE